MGRTVVNCVHPQLIEEGERMKKRSGQEGERKGSREREARKEGRPSNNCSKVWGHLELSLFLKEKHIFCPLK